MRVIFRTDVSAAIGTGHIVRCLALAGALSRRGVAVEFVCREMSGGLTDLVAAEGYRLHLLPPGQNDPDQDGPAHAHWLGASTAEDADATLHAIHAGPRPDWLVVDHYALDQRWESAMRAAAGRIAVIDDLADRQHDCDLLIDQNLGAESKGHNRLVGENCRLLLGPCFSLLRPEFAAARHKRYQEGSRACRLLVSFGGCDSAGLTLRTLAAIRKLRRSDLVVDVVVGQHNPSLPEIEEEAAALSQASIHVQTPHMADLMSRADLMIGAAGSTTWERCCMGLPGIMVAVAENQQPIGAAIGYHRAGWYLGTKEVADESAIGSAIDRLLQRPRLLERISSRASKMTDGRGADRVASALIGRHRITLITDSESWLNPYLHPFVAGLRQAGHTVKQAYRAAEVEEGDCALFLSCCEIVKRDVLERNVHNLVVHASRLPEGRGWSPWVWQILENKNTIPMTLFEAAYRVDSGVIYLQDSIDLKGHELLGDIRASVAMKTIELCRRFVASYPCIASSGRSQKGLPTYYRRRTAADSQLNPDSTIREQFNLLRVVDNERYPAFFEIGGHRYLIKIVRA